MTRGIPSASRKTVFQVFDEVHRATDEELFSQRTFQQKGVTQFRQALTLMNFLGLLSGSGRLNADLLDVRRSPTRLQDLLRERLQRKCIDAGCTDEEVAFLGELNVSEPELTKRIRDLTPIRNQRSASAQSNCVGCVRALYEMIVSGCTRDWLEKELRAIELKGNKSDDLNLTRPHGSSNESSEIPNRLEATTSPDSVDVAFSKFLQNADVSEAKQYVVDFSENGDPIYAYVTLTHPVNPVHLTRLAKQLMEEKEGMEVPLASRSQRTARP